MDLRPTPCPASLGNKEVLGRDRLMQLPPQLLQYPAMGFCCALDDVVPSPAGQAWSDDAAEFLQDLTQEKLSANVVRKSDMPKQLILRLSRSVAPNSDVVDEMVRRGIASR